MRLAERRHRSCDIHCAAACWSRMLTRNDGQTAGTLQSISLTSCWGGLCVHPGGVEVAGGGRDRRREMGAREGAERERGRGKIKLVGVELRAISIFSISL